MDEQRSRKTYEYKLTRTLKQEQELDRTLTLCRHIYHAAIEERRAAWRLRGVSVSYYQQKAEVTSSKDALPEYGEVHSQVLQDMVLRVDRASQAYFRRVVSGETPGYPRFLVLSKIGRISVRWSRPMEGMPTSVTISREADGWHARFSCADAPIQPLSPAGHDTDIDLGLEAFATLSNGSRIVHPAWYRKEERRLEAAHRRVSRRKQGSNRRRKAVQLLAKARMKVRRQRHDFHHTVALRWVQANDTISHEDLQTANMVRNHHLAKSIRDAGWSMVLTILAFKAAYAGKRVVAVPPASTSQRCSGCGVVVSKGLPVRWRSCPDCGTSLHRDHDAARNREGAGQARRGGAGVPASENRASAGL
jgi:putative transposase